MTFPLGDERGASVYGDLDARVAAAEAIGKIQLFLSSFSRVDTDPLKLSDQIQDIPGVLNKAQIVASEQTFEAMNDFQDFMIASVTDLIHLRIRVEHLQSEIREQQLSISNLNQYGSFLQERLRSTPAEDPLRVRLNTELARVQTALSTAHARHVELTDKNVQATEELGRGVLHNALAAGVEVGKLNLRIRQELDLPIDEEWYLTRLNERLEKRQPKIDQIYQGLERVFAETEPEGLANPGPAADR